MTLALLTGATGFVGSHLLDAMLARGYRVRCTVRRTSDLRWLSGKAYEPVEGDLRDAAGLARAMEGVDVVFHVAGVLTAESPAKFREGNVLTTRRMVEAAVAAKVRRFVDVSSLAAAGPSVGGVPVDEESPCRPISMYGRSKLEAEEEVWRRRGEIGVTVIRPPVVYGTRDRGLLEMYRLLQAGLRPEIGGPKFVSIVHVEDLVRGILDVAEHRDGVGIFYLSDERPRSYGELMTAVLAALGRSACRLHVPDDLLLFLGSVSERVEAMLGRKVLFSRDKAIEMTQPRWVCTSAKAGRLLGWEARVPLEAGMRDAIAWYRSEGWLR